MHVHPLGCLDYIIYCHVLVFLLGDKIEFRVNKKIAAERDRKGGSGSASRCAVHDAYHTLHSRLIKAPHVMVSLKLQKRLAASVLNCGARKIWMDPNEVRV
jgi:hypothetical protein